VTGGHDPHLSKATGTPVVAVIELRQFDAAVVRIRSLRAGRSGRFGVRAMKQARPQQGSLIQGSSKTRTTRQAQLPDAANGLNSRQRAIRRHVDGQPLPGAIRLAAFAFFRFTHSSSSGEALWSDSQHVWLGKKTFMHWAMFDPEINIPHSVSTAADVPAAPEALGKIVRTELNRYWTYKLRSLPHREDKGWIPLP
jgi:hypothetical protein